MVESHIVSYPVARGMVERRIVSYPVARDMVESRVVAQERQTCIQKVTASISVWDSRYFLSTNSL